MERFASLFQITYGTILRMKHLALPVGKATALPAFDDVLLILFLAQGQMSQLPCGLSGGGIKVPTSRKRRETWGTPVRCLTKGYELLR